MKASRSTRRAFLAIFFSLGSLACLGVLGTAALVLSGCQAIESGADSLADMTAGSTVSNVFRGTARMAEGMRSYSPSEEHYIGRAVAAEILSKYKVHDDPRLTEYVNLIGLSIASSSPDVLQTFSGYHFTILESDEVNAISAPAGFIFLTLGTVARARDEDELAAVLAHEIAHVTLRHGISAIQAATRKRSTALLVQGIGETAAAGASGSSQDSQLIELTGLFASAIQDITSELLVKGYDRKSEYAADKLGADFQKAAGYSRAALISYLRRLGSEGGKGGWYGTHPTAEDRIDALGDIGKDDTSAAVAGVPLREKRFKANRGA